MVLYVTDFKAEIIFIIRLTFRSHHVYVSILSVHLEAISSEQLHLKTSNVSEYCVET